MNCCLALRRPKGRGGANSGEVYTMIRVFLSAFGLLGLFALLPATASQADSPPLPHSVFDGPPAKTPTNEIDQAVFAQIDRLGLKSANLCCEAVFLRRVYLDVIGTLPTQKEAADYLADKSPDKRRLLIDRLLERKEFADYWAMRWSDWLRVKAEFPVNLWPNAAQAYYHWIHTAIRDNMPYDKFARELLLASGSNFRQGQVNFLRAMQGREPKTIAQTVALTFMGARAELWPKDRLADMSVFFSQVGYKKTNEWKEEIVFYDLAKSPSAALTAKLPDGTAVKLEPGTDPRVAFADWLITPQNSWFTPAIVNRIWAALLGRGIVQEPDDFRPDNSPSNPQLLAALQKQFVASHYDLKQLFRTILNSNTYQLSSVPAGKDPRIAANFAAYPLHRLDAEILVDALNEITGGSEDYSSAIPEPFTFIPKNIRSICLPDGSITSTFLESFGKSSRTSGLFSERNNNTTAAQRLELLNSSYVLNKLAQSQKLKALLRSTANPPDRVNALYLTILSRYPTAQEFKIVGDYFQAGRDGGGAANGPIDPQTDVAWALINSTEFMYRH